MVQPCKGSIQAEAARVGKFHVIHRTERSTVKSPRKDRSPGRCPQVLFGWPVWGLFGGGKERDYHSSDDNRQVGRNG